MIVYHHRYHTSNDATVHMRNSNRDCIWRFPEIFCHSSKKSENLNYLVKVKSNPTLPTSVAAVRNGWSLLYLEPWALQATLEDDDDRLIIIKLFIACQCCFILKNGQGLGSMAFVLINGLTWLWWAWIQSSEQLSRRWIIVNWLTNLTHSDDDLKNYCQMYWWWSHHHHH